MARNGREGRPGAHLPKDRRVSSLPEEGVAPLEDGLVPPGGGSHPCRRTVSSLSEWISSLPGTPSSIPGDGLIPPRAAVVRPRRSPRPFRRGTLLPPRGRSPSSCRILSSCPEDAHVCPWRRFHPSRGRSHPARRRFHSTRRWSHSTWRMGEAGAGGRVDPGVDPVRPCPHEAAPPRGGDRAARPGSPELFRHGPGRPAGVAGLAGRDGAGRPHPVEERDHEREGDPRTSEEEPTNNRVGKLLCREYVDGQWQDWREDQQKEWMVYDVLRCLRDIPFMVGFLDCKDQFLYEETALKKSEVMAEQKPGKDVECRFEYDERYGFEKLPEDIWKAESISARRHHRPPGQAPRAASRLPRARARAPPLPARRWARLGVPERSGYRDRSAAGRRRLT